MSHFKSLLARGNTLDKLKQQTNNVPGQSRRDDEGYWSLTTDKAGNGRATLRFLPNNFEDTTDAPFVAYYRHAFQGPGGWYIENSRTSIEEQDPLGEWNARLWATGDDKLKDQVRKQSRKLTYVSNVLVLKDPGKPENEGKVFRYRYGKKIFDMLKKVTEAEDADDEVFDPFHPLEGADFKLNAKKVANFPNYDDSKFANPKPLFDGDEDKINDVLDQLTKLSEVIAPDKFKSYDELLKKLNRTVGFDTTVYLTAAEAQVSVQSSGGVTAKAASPSAPQVPANVGGWTPPKLDDDDDDDDVDSKFKDDDDD